MLVYFLCQVNNWRALRLAQLHAFCVLRHALQLAAADCVQGGATVFLVSIIFRIRTRKCTKLFTENITEYFAHAQTVCTRPLLGLSLGGGGGGGGGGGAW